MEPAVDDGTARLTVPVPDGLASNLEEVQGLTSIATHGRQPNRTGDQHTRHGSLRGWRADCFQAVCCFWSLYRPDVGFCAGCTYDVKQETGPKACPFNYLYWAFLIRQKDRLSDNPRMAMPYRNLAGWPHERKAKILAETDAFLDQLDWAGIRLAVGLKRRSPASAGRMSPMGFSRR
jgi:hypothetical protein